MRDLHRMRWCDRLPVAGLLALALAVAGCTAGGGLSTSTPAPADASPSFSDKVKNFFSNSTAKSRQAATGPQTDVYCPYIEIRQGASTLSIGPPGDNAAMTLKYQGTFVRAARECGVVGTDMVMKIGVQGRLIVGPAGGPGDVVVPLRIAVVHETTGGSQTITTKLIRIPVSVGPARRTRISRISRKGWRFRCRRRPRSRITWSISDLIRSPLRPRTRRPRSPGRSQTRATPWPGGLRFWGRVRAATSRAGLSPRSSRRACRQSRFWRLRQKAGGQGAARYGCRQRSRSASCRPRLPPRRLAPNPRPRRSRPVRPPCAPPRAGKGQAPVSSRHFARRKQSGFEKA